MEFKTQLRNRIELGDYTQKEAAQIISKYAKVDVSLHTLKGWLQGNHIPQGARLRAAKRFINEVVSVQG